LKFNIRDIGPEGLHVARHLDAGGVHTLLAPVGVDLTAPGWEAQLDVTLSRLDTTVVMHGTLTARFGVRCSRCLAPASVHLDEQALNITFLPPARGGADDEEVDDIDTFAHDGEEVDLEAALRELLVLAIPMAPLCRPECRGICSGCGADLNGEPCRCAPAKRETETEKTPWAAAISRLKNTR
jgi:uncharacterized protein